MDMSVMDINMMDLSVMDMNMMDLSVMIMALNVVMGIVQCSKDQP